MRHSHVAIAGTETAGLTMPKLNAAIVRAARSSAGLSRGKNFSTPNQKKTMPTLIRSTVTPCSATQPVNSRSARASPMCNWRMVSSFA